MASSLYVHEYATASGDASQEENLDAYCVLECCDPATLPEVDPSSITFFGALESEEGDGREEPQAHHQDQPDLTAVATRPPGFLSRVLAAFLQWLRNHNRARVARGDSRHSEGGSPLHSKAGGHEEIALVQLRP